MTRTIIYAHVGAPGLVDVSAQLVFGTFDLLWQDFADKLLCLLTGLLMPILEGTITKPHGLLDRGSFLQVLVQFGEIGLEDSELGDLACRTYWLALNGLHIS